MRRKAFPGNNDVKMLWWIKQELIQLKKPIPGVIMKWHSKIPISHPLPFFSWQQTYCQAPSEAITINMMSITILFVYVCSFAALGNCRSNRRACFALTRWSNAALLSLQNWRDFLQQSHTVAMVKKKKWQTCNVVKAALASLLARIWRSKDWEHDDAHMRGLDAHLSFLQANFKYNHPIVKE